MNLRDFEYGYPSGVYWILALPVIAVLYWLAYRNWLKALSLFAAAGVLEKMACRSSRALKLTMAMLVGLAWVMGVLAFMQPRGSARYLGEESEGGEVLEEEVKEENLGRVQSIVQKRKAHDVVFLLDTSASMSVTDTRTGVTRLEQAKELVEEMVANLEGQNVALYAFTSEVTPVVPLTLDYLYTLLQLKRVQINEGDVAGTDLMEALSEIQQRHLKKGKNHLKTVVLLTDGGDTRLESAPASQREQELEAILSRVKGSEEQNFRLFTVGLGSRQGEVIPDITFDGKPVRSSLDEELMEKLSKLGRGRYYFANEYSLLGIAKDVKKQMDQDSPFIEEEIREEVVGEVARTVEGEGPQELVYDRYFQLPLTIGFFALLVAICLPKVRRNSQALLVVMLFLGGWSSLEGGVFEEKALSIEQAVHEGRLGTAVEGLNALLTEELSPKQQAIVTYNLGSVQMRREMWTKAIDTLSKVESEETPVLSRHVYLSLAIARLEAARDLVRENEMAAALTELKEGEKALDQAVEVDQQLALIEGRDLAETNEELVNLRQALREETGLVNEQIEKLRVDELEIGALQEELLRKITERLRYVETAGLQRWSQEKEAQFLVEQSILSKQSEPLWAALRKHLTDEKTETSHPNEIYFQAEEQALTARELMAEKQLWSGRERLVMARTLLDTAGRLEEKKDPLGPLLEARLATRKRMKVVEEFPAFHQSLEQEDQELTRFTGQLLQGLRDAWEKEVLESEEKEELTLAIQLAEALSQQLSEKGFVAAKRDLALHTQIVKSESDVLAGLYTEIVKSEKVLVEMLQKKLRYRAEITTDQEKKERIDRVLGSLDRFHEGETLDEKEDALEQALLDWDGERLVVEKLRLLERDYSQVRNRQVLSESELDQLANQEKVIRSLAERITLDDEHGSTLAADLSEVGRRRELATEAKGQVNRKLYLALAHRTLVRSIEHFQKDSQTPPQAILKKGIADQKEIITLTKEASESELFYLLNAEELEIISDVEKIGGNEEQGQMDPEALKLVNEGIVEANQAAQELRNVRLNLDQVVEHQETAVTKWEEALDQQENEPDSQDEDQEPEKQEEEQNDSSEEQSTLSNDVMELLQQMDREDQLEQKGTVVPKRGLRPW